MFALAVLMMLMGAAAVAGLAALAVGTGQWWLFLMLPIGFMPAGFGWGLFRTLREQRDAAFARSPGGSGTIDAIEDDTAPSAAAWTLYSGAPDHSSSRTDDGRIESLDHATRYGSDVGPASGSDGASSSGDSSSPGDGGSSSSGTD